MRDLHEEKDGGWMRLYPERSERIALGEVGVRGTGEDLAIVSFANGFYLSCQAQAELERAGIATRVIDMRWLSPLPKEALTSAVRGRSEEHTSELQSLMRTSYAVFCLKKKKRNTTTQITIH